MTYFAPVGSGRKTTPLLRGHEYFISTKFHQNQSSSPGEEIENVKRLRRADDSLTIAQSSCYFLAARGQTVKLLS